MSALNVGDLVSYTVSHDRDVVRVEVTHDGRTGHGSAIDTPMGVDVAFIRAVRDLQRQGEVPDSHDVST